MVIKKIALGITADLHVHLRQGKMMELITPTVRQGGISVAYVMPNLTPPITTIESVKKYHTELSKISPETTFLMTLYLCKDLTPELVEEAAKLKLIKGIKCYPAGVTTNSQAGVDPNDFTGFYPIFKVMQEYGLVLNLHGEKPSIHSDIEEDDDDDEREEIHVLNAEPKFLPALIKLHSDFPNLKIVLEHCTTKEAIEAVDKINQQERKSSSDPVIVAASITAHHLSLTIDNWAGDPINYCKPVAKLPSDKKALIKAAVSGKPYFFFGSDSAPHELCNKSKHIGVCAGVYTQLYALGYLAQVFEKHNKLDKLKDFVSTFGLNFYQLKDEDIVCKDTVSLIKEEFKIPELLKNEQGDIVVAPFKPGETLNWKVEWSQN
ncbi:hypothetical protein PACTADRAFT_35480 [Pachysolen tannophilus NRRL Y-2460]|uniref:dihydroorotase n=1 Tax=Pachysolen tannophilus NRRL Y-2460 TaxID=669874 RepID=A0A1E4TPQ0_PACTA|nr:hypothetical protein PACTADRAFT_35480 [Pachysolen tannophilus NRRL Y-2460]